MILYDLVKSGLESFQGLDLSRLSHSQESAAILLSIALFIVVLLKSLLSRNKFSQKGSGYLISDRYRIGLLRRAGNFALKSILASGVILLLAALTEPFIPILKTVATIKESRERIDLIDVSTSKGWLYESTGRPAGELGRKAHLKFLNMRRGKNDRVALWVFSTHAFQIEDFIVDDQVYFDQVYDAPYVVIDPDNYFLPGRGYHKDKLCDVLVPIERLNEIKDEGQTRLEVGLQAVIKDFDQKGTIGLKERAVMVETDAAAEAPIDSELSALYKRGIHIYFLKVKSNKECEARGGAKDIDDFVKKLQSQVEKYGGKFYDVADENSMVRAYADIDRLETAKIKTISVTNKIPLFQLFIFFGILAIAGGIFLIFLAEIPGVYP